MATFTDQLLVLPSTGVVQKMAAGDTIELSSSNLIIGGDLTVSGTKFTTAAQTVLLADNHTYVNAGYTANTAQTGGLVVNYLPTALSTTSVGAGDFTPGVGGAGGSDPTVTTADPSVFSISDLVQISGTANGGENDGLYEVISHSITGLLTIRSTASGITPQVEDFTDDQFVAHLGDTGATFTKVTVSVLRAGIDGAWETGSGSSTGIVFADLASAAGSTLQSAYDAGQAVTLVDTSGDMVVTLDDTGIAANFKLIGTGAGDDYLKTDAANAQIILGSAITDVRVPDNAAFKVGTGINFNILHDTVNTTMTSATGDLIIDNTFATGSTINRLGTSDLNTDFQVQNVATSPLFSVLGSGQADFVGNVDATGGLDVDANNVSLTVGLTAEWGVLHNGVDTVMTNTFGDMIIDNVNLNGTTAIQLGTDTGVTSFEVRNNTGIAKFRVDGLGATSIPATMTGDSLAITESNTAKVGASLDVTWGAVAATGAAGMHLNWSPMISLTSGVDQYGLNLDGKTNSGAGNSVAVSIDAAWDVGIENDSSMRMGEILDPTAVASKGFLYVKSDVTDTELFYMDSLGAVTQITKDGQLAVDASSVYNTSFTNGELTDITAGDCVAILSGTTVTWADATSIDAHMPFGIAQNTALGGGVVNVQSLQGSVLTTSIIAGFAAVGDVVYLTDIGTTGNTLSTAAPTVSGSTIYRAGYAISSTSLIWSPEFIAVNP